MFQREGKEREGEREMKSFPFNVSVHRNTNIQHCCDFHTDDECQFSANM